MTPPFTPAMLLLLAGLDPSFAGEPGHDCPVPFVEKAMPYTQVLLVPRECATTVPDWKLREVEAGRGPSGPVLEFEDQRQVVTEMRLESHEVEQQVVCTESRPVTVTDPCTGHCRTTYEPCEVVKTVKVRVYETVPVQREVVVKVPVLRHGPEVVVRRLTLDLATAPAVLRRYEAVTTPNEVKFAVPVQKVPVPPCTPAEPVPVPKVPVLPCPMVPPGH
jgi:hypothetical protein